MKQTYVIVLLLLSTCVALARQSPAETAVWKLEHSYWEDVKALDLVSYRKLWHPNFVGWPYSSARPQRKDHITDWITSQTVKGLHLKSYALEPADSQATDNIVITYYWCTTAWVDKNGRGEASLKLRFMHTWMRVGQGWQIIGGMAAPVTKAKN